MASKKKQSDELKQQIAAALAAAEDKKAERITVLKLDASASGFTDYFLICSARNPRQIQSISDEVEQRLQKVGQRPAHVEGYKQAEWVLLDYVDFVVHVFSDKARQFYDLERLWKSATRLDPADLLKPARPKKAASAAKAARPRARARRTPAS